MSISTSMMKISTNLQNNIILYLFIYLLSHPASVQMFLSYCYKKIWLNYIELELTICFSPLDPLL